jgi:two-component system torCAD operon response regulator TorR
MAVYSPVFEIDPSQGQANGLNPAESPMLPLSCGRFGARRWDSRTLPSVRVLLVEDDPILSEVIIGYFRQEGIDVLAAADAAAGLRLFARHPVDLALVDVNLPDRSGHDLVRDLKRRRDCPVIYVTSRGGAEERVWGLQAADDYVVKPIDVRELMARVKAVLRRYRPPTSVVNAVVELGGWTLDIVRRELADPAGAPVRLTRAEFDLFAALAQVDGVTLSRDYLLEVVASAEAPSKSRTVDVLVSRIQTVRDGYRLGRPAA